MPEAPTIEAPQAAPEPSIEDRMMKFQSGPISDAPVPKPVKETPKPEPKAKVEPAKETPKPEPAKTEPKTEPKVEAKAESKAEPVKEAPKEEPKAAPRPWEMYRGEKKAREELAAKHAELEKKYQEAVSSKPQVDPTAHPDFVKYKTRAEELENEIRFVNYEKSEEFKTKYEQPYNKVATQLTKEATELMREVEDGNGGTAFKAVSPNEFWQVVNQPNSEQAHQAAKNLFGGDSAKVAEVIRMRREIRQNYERMAEAREDYRKNGAEREKQQLAEKTKAQQTEARKTQEQALERSRIFSESVESELSNPDRKDFFTAAEDDPKGKELLTKGRSFADKLIGNVEEGEAPPTDEERAKMDAAAYARVASWPYMAHQLKNLKTQMAEMQKKLDEYESSEPGKGEAGKGGAPQSSEDDIDARMMKFAQ